jgi:diguanylate cyclase (GGDEF)-like protein
MSLLPMQPMPPYPDFATASRAVVAFLKIQIPMAVWTVNRTDGTLMVVLHPSEGNGYGIRSGDAMAYSDSMCSRMVAGLAPNIAPDVGQHPGYRDAPGRGKAIVNSYVSFPLQRADGQLFGTLCGFDPQVQPLALLGQAPLIELLSRQLSTILQFDLDRDSAWHLALKHEASALTDALTGLGNRRAFELTCEREEERCRDIGQPLVVIQIDLDGLKATNDRSGHDAGDELIRSAATALRGQLRADAHVARIGGDEFVVLLPGCVLKEAEQVGERLRRALQAVGAEASLGCAERKPYRGLADALRRADAAMYEDKQRRKGGQRTG